MKRLTVKEMKVFAYHGVLDEEKESGQEFLIDMEIDLDEASSREDELAATVDYAEVTEAVAAIATGERFNLIETLAEAVLRYLLDLEGVRSASVTVKKPQAPLAVEAAWVGVTVSRSADPPETATDGEDVGG
jgi:dihydroneopterin aldolase